MYEQEKSEIQTLKSYLLSQIPTTPLPPNDILLTSNSVALKAAIAGLDKELVRLEREERLVKKFTANSSSDNTMESSGVMVGKKGEDDADMEYVKMTKEDAAATEAEDVAMDDDGKDDEEWEEAEASAKKHQKQNEDDENAKVCQKLASSSVARIANANIKVATPLGALGLALHTALVELSDETSGDPIFKCTGVPDVEVASKLLGVQVKSKIKGGGGFAPPIRELPRGELVPLKWEEYSFNGGVIAFRYKCGSEVYSTDSGSHNSDATTLYLALQLLEGNEVSVTFGTLPSKDQSEGEKNHEFKFPLGQHVNLDGFQAAKTKIGGGIVSPSLFYVGLSALLTRFSSTFPVLPKAPTGEEAAAFEMPTTKADVMGQQFDRSVPLPCTEGIKVNVARPNIPPDGAAVDTTDHRDPLRDMDSRRDKHGDFEGDLLPGGPQPGGLHDTPRSGMGSQVGPDHPMFDRNFGDEGEGYNNGYEDDLGFGNGGESFGIPGVGGGMGMRPRYVHL